VTTRSALLLVLLAALSCRQQPPPGPALRALLDVALEQGGLSAQAAAETRAEIDRLAQGAVAAIRRGERPAEVFRRALFQEARFSREIDRQEARFMLLPGVLRERRGTCVGLGSLYLALAEAAGVPAHGVLVPGHFFVRVREGAGLANVELLRQGEPMPDSWYRTKYGVPAQGAAAYLRNLSIPEVAAVLRFNLANGLRERGRPGEALARYRRVVADFPAFAEAHASIGLMQHLLGRLPEARRAYQEARRLHAGLPGLERNMAVLEADLKKTDQDPPDTPSKIMRNPQRVPRLPRSFAPSKLGGSAREIMRNP
jgi:regulator of sirC expression with transglutaminase-like and TPR domain